jgi:predicted ABC-type transport system involved in lysophospholipase L1 biosynthesis ATPase subunit
MSAFAVVLVHSTSHAIHAERVLKRVGLKVKLIPTPRHLSSDCGSAVRIAAADHDRAEAALADAGVPLDRIEILDA